MTRLTSALLLCLALSSLPARARDGDRMPIGGGQKRPEVTLIGPTGGWSVGRMLRVEGSVSDPTCNPVVVSINGDRYLLRTDGSGHFSREFPAANGKNVVTVMATNLGGTGSEQVTTYAQVPPVPLKAVLTSDTDGVYTDLHIYEPTDASVKDGVLDASKMAHVFWENTQSPSGGTFFLNEQAGNFDQPGYGPYLYIHRAPPKGVYLIATNYWPSGDRAHTIAYLNLTLFEGTPNEVRRLVRVPLATHGTTKALAWINILDSEHALVYVPGQDRLPSVDKRWPSNLADATKSITSSSMDEGGGD